MKASGGTSSRRAWRAVLGGVMLALGLTTAAQAADDGAAPLWREKDAVCIDCHDESENKPILSIYQTRHGVKADARTPTCQDCHGESKNHLHGNTDGKGRPPPDLIYGTKHSPAGYKPDSAHAQSEPCLSCHQGGKHINWQSSAHANRDVACTSCHVMHTSHDAVRDKATQTEVCYACHKEQRAQMNRPTHHPVPEGEMTCTSCHDLHNDNPKALVKSSTNDTCFSCHMEKRGPFVHNHDPVQEDCALCHQPHGTTVASLLKQRPPFLCQQCHSNTLHPAVTAFQQGTTGGTLPAAFANGGQVGGRSCNNCHTNIHGSNSTQSGTGVGNHGAAGHFRR